MAKILTTKGSAAELEDLIRKASNNIYLIRAKPKSKFDFKKNTGSLTNVSVKPGVTGANLTQKGYNKHFISFYFRVFTKFAYKVILKVGESVI